MNKNLNNNFIKQLIDSDFIFNKISSRKHLADFSNIFLDQKNIYSILNIFKLNTSLKQFIRILQLLKEKKNFHIHILCQNRYLLDLIKKFLEDYRLSSKISVTEIFPEIDLSTNNLNYVFILGEPLERGWDKLITTKFSKYRIFLVSNISFTVERYNIGVYRIQNDFHDYKKLLVLLVIIYNTLKNK